MLVEKSSVVVETKKIGPNYEASSAWEEVENINLLYFTVKISKLTMMQPKI